MTKLEKIFLLNVLLYVDSTESVKKFISINKKCQEKDYDIIRQNMTDVIIPTKSARIAAINTNLVFFILTALV